MKNIAYFLFLLLLTSCSRQIPAVNIDTEHATWQEITAAAKSTTVEMLMWGGDPQINRYMTRFVAPKLKQNYGIDLHLIGAQGNEIVKQLLSEKEAGQAVSGSDICWINGETFYQLRQIDALYGNYLPQLPNYQYIDTNNVYIKYDFGQPTNGYECAWGNVQQIILYDTIRTPQPPRTMADLEVYIRAHPGKFTIPSEFTGLTLMKGWLIALANDKNALEGAFDAQKYETLSKELWAFINRNKPYFWRGGKTFPENVAAMHQLFANKELDFTFSNNDAEADNKILQNVLPASTRAYVWQSGTIQNSHYLGITAKANNRAGAMVVLNFLISPEAQFEKQKPSEWGDGTVLDMAKIPAEWREKFLKTPHRTASPARAALQPYALRELAPEYMIRLAADFRKYVLEQ